MTDTLIETEGLTKYYPISAGLWGERKFVHAVDNVTFYIKRGETFGLVGESGCGKTTLGKLILRLIEPTAGEVLFDGQPVFKLDERDFRKLRRNIQIIFQDPYASLNPRMTVRNIIGRPMELHGISRGVEKDKNILELLDRVGLSPEHIDRYPHEFSGGQRQRIAIARALCLNPEFIILDEPTSALDVSVQAQILNLLKQLQKQFELTYLFISHNLSAIRHITSRVAVMYLGKIVEVAGVKDLFESPLHPYAQALISACPVPDPKVRRKRIILRGEAQSPVNPPKACRFHTRCPYSTRKCSEEEPELTQVKSNHMVACHLIA